MMVLRDLKRFWIANHALNALMWQSGLACIVGFLLGLLGALACAHILTPTHAQATQSGYLKLLRQAELCSGHNAESCGFTSSHTKLHHSQKTALMFWTLPLKVQSARPSEKPVNVARGASK